jgi:hypothetical protein
MLIIMPDENTPEVDDGEGQIETGSRYVPNNRFNTGYSRPYTPPKRTYVPPTITYFEEMNEALEDDPKEIEEVFRNKFMNIIKSNYNNSIKNWLIEIAEHYVEY